MTDETDTTSEVGDAIRELAHVVRTEDEIEGIALQVDDLWRRVQGHQALADERDMLKRGGAELGRQIDHYLTWVLDATGMHHLIDEDGDGDWELVWERLAEMGQARKAQEAQIATQAPAEQPHAPSGGNGTGGGLGERLRLLARAQLVRMTKSSDEGTRRHGNGLLGILDGAGGANETDGATSAPRASGGALPDGGWTIFDREGTECLLPLTSRPELIESANQTLANFGLQPMTPEEIAGAQVHPPEGDNPFKTNHEEA